MRKTWTALCGVLLVCLAVLFAGGCNSKSVSSVKSGTASAGGQAIYTIKAAEKTMIAIERTGRRVEVPLPPEYKLNESDIIENKGTKPATLTETKKGHKFVLAPQAKIQVSEQTLTLIQGGSSFTFRKMNGEFKIVLPQATLSIRGTEFGVIVLADGRSAVRMKEGTIEIDQAGTQSSLKAPQAALFSGASGPVQVFPEASALPAEWLSNPTWAEIASENASDGEDVSRSRKSGY